MRRLSASPIVRIVLITGCLSAFAQISRNPGQWVGDLLSLAGNTSPEVVLIDEDGVITKRIPTGAPDWTKLSGVQADGIKFVENKIWYSDALYAISGILGIPPKTDADGNPFREFSFLKWQDDEWHDIGTYRNPHIRSAIRSIPCDNDRFIAISFGADLAGNTGSRLTPFARMSLNPEKKEVRVHSSIDHDQDDLRMYMSNANCFSIASLSNIIVTGKLATLLSYKTGLFWTFSMETANLKKTGNIFKKMTPEMILNGGLADAVFCAHPEKEGTILISAKPEELFAADKYADAMRELRAAHPTMAPADLVALHFRQMIRATEDNPLIDWYRLDPETGKVEKTFPPEGAAMLRDGFKNDFWVPKPDGSVRMGFIPLNESENAERKMKEAPAK